MFKWLLYNEFLEVIISFSKTSLISFFGVTTMEIESDCISFGNGKLKGNTNCISTL